MSRQPCSAVEILNGIPSETGQQLFNAVRYHTHTAGSTGIPDLDEYILKSDGSFSRQSSLNKGDVIEIQGPAASGKTQLLYHMTAICILPYEIIDTSLDAPSEHRIFVGGREKSVVVFDCDGRWDIHRLREVVITRIHLAFQRAPMVAPPSHRPALNVKSIALKCLSRLHVFRPTSSLQLAATLLSLPKYHEEQMPQEEIHMLLVDSIGSFYWMDRWQVESSGSKKVPRYNPLGNVLRSLHALRLSHGPVIVLTNWGLNPLPSEGSSSLVPQTPFFKQHLPSPFPAPFEESQHRSLSGDVLLPLACHTTLLSSFVPQLQYSLKHANEILLREALADERRRKAVETVGTEVFIRIPRSESTHQGTLAGGFGRFRFMVLENDVVASHPALSA